MAMGRTGPLPVSAPSGPMSTSSVAVRDDTSGVTVNQVMGDQYNYTTIVNYGNEGACLQKK